MKKGIRESGMRWFILFLACNFYFGAYYCYDNFGPIETEIKEELNIDSAQYLLLYSVYSYPGCFMPVLGGMLMDSIGIRIGLFTFTLINTIGQFVVWYGTYKNQFWVMLVGRTIFGFTGDAMAVA